MPKTSLTPFLSFTEKLLPHELSWLCINHRLADPEKISILDTLKHNLFYPEQSRAHDPSIDKRKYSYIKGWIGRRLRSIDVDVFYRWLCLLDEKIMTDALSLEDEKKIINYIRSYNHPGYYFLRFYELMQNYRHFLLIRVRHENYDIIGNFLQTYEQQYKRGQTVFQELHNATTDIVSQYKLYARESRSWEQTLITVFEDETLDGLNRYFAIVRLTFLYYVYKEYDRLLQLFDRLDALFSNGRFYSPRILVNYYSNRLLIHARENDLGKARYYGYFSLRHKSNDYLQYLNNLSAVLMRSGNHKEALELHINGFPDFKKTLSSHNRIGFAAFYIQALIRNKRPAEAVSYAQSFLDSHKEDILRNRWHIFFTSFVFALLETEQYSKIVSLTKKYKLLHKEEMYRKKAGYIPSFIWIHELARYKELQISARQLFQALYETSLPYIPDVHKFRLMKEMCNELMHHEPATFGQLFQKLFARKTYKVTPRYMA